MLLKETFLD